MKKETQHSQEEKILGGRSAPSTGSTTITGTVVVDATGQGPVPVSGTVTTELSAVDNAVLDNIDTQTLASQVALESIDGALIGPGEPSVDSYANIAINLTTGANQVLVSSAADKQIWVYGFGLTVGDAAGQTVSFQDEDDTAITGVMEFSQYGGMVAAPSGNFSMPIWKLDTNKDLEVDITGGDVDGWLSYAIISAGT